MRKETYYMTKETYYMTKETYYTYERYTKETCQQHNLNVTYLNRLVPFLPSANIADLKAPVVELQQEENSIHNHHSAQAYSRSLLSYSRSLLSYSRSLLSYSIY